MDDKKMIRKPAEKFVSLCRNILCGICLLLFGYLAVINLLFTTRFDTTSELAASETGLFCRDSLLLFVPAAAAAVLLWMLLRKWLKNVPSRRIALVITQLIFWGGVFWALLVNVEPRADQWSVLETAGQWLESNYYNMKEYGYIFYYPFQMGISALLVPFAALFGVHHFIPIQIFNAVLIALTFWALYRIGEVLMPRETDNGRAVLLLSLGAWCAVMFSIFVYGNVPGNCLAILALWLQLRWQVEHKSWWNLLLGGLSLGLSILLKSFSLIFLIAQTIMLILCWLRTGRKQGIALLLTAILVWQGCAGALNAWGEGKIGKPMNKGIPMTGWLVMGTGVGGGCPGWYTGFPKVRYMELEFDRELAQQDAEQTLQKNIDKMVEDPAWAASFFHRKTLSQWAEPTYQVFWLACTGDMVPAVHQFLFGIGQNIITWLMNWYQSLIYVCAFGFLIARRKTLTLEQLLPGLVILGGFLFQLFWEGKSQYCIQYFLLAIPYAAAGLNLFAGWMSEKMAARRRPAAADNKQ